MGERVRAGGRSERVRRQVGKASLALLTEGRLDLTPAEVAQRSGVSRTTVYRWWPTKPALVREALAVHTDRRVDPPDTGTWHGDLDALAHRLTAFFSDPVEVALNSIMASGSSPDFDALVLDHFAPVFDAWRGMVERARTRGELRPNVDADTVLLTLASPLLTIPLLFHRSPSPDEVRRIADTVYAGTTSTPAPLGRPGPMEPAVGRSDRSDPS
jgi:AcrR family transcriptional regulator